MGAAGGFGRRASDGGANLQTFFQKHIEHSDWSAVEQQQKQQQQHHQQLQQQHHHQQQEQEQQSQQQVGAMDALHHLSNSATLNSQTLSHSPNGCQVSEQCEDSSNSMELKR